MLLFLYTFGNIVLSSDQNDDEYMFSGLVFLCYVKHAY